MRSRFMLKSADTKKVSDYIRECARLHIVPYFKKLADDQKHFKGGDPRNLVTIADREAEAFLTEKLGRLLPSAGVVGEEATELDPALPDILKDTNALAWVIDPVDGTNNFARGSKTFCVLVALVTEGATQAGWLYDVLSDRMYLARRGEGASVDGAPVRVKAGPGGGKGFSSYRGLVPVPDIKLGSLSCSGHEYMQIARGEALFSVYRKMKPWDHLAGTLLVQEAGGIVTKWDESPYRPGDTTGGLVTAASEDYHRLLLRAIPEVHLQHGKVSP